MNEKTLIIAEAGVNHNGDMKIARQLIDIAADSGADIVKFQMFKASKLVSRQAKKAAYQERNLGDGDPTQFNMLKKLETTYEMHVELMDYSREHGISFLSTAFDVDSLLSLDKLGLDRIKVPSGEITNLPYLKTAGSLGKEIILSTGMADLGEIEDALDVLTQSGTDLEHITVLHCNTEYPTPFEDVNLRAMTTIANAFNVKVGYSDHTPGIEVPVAAVALGAKIIEKHFTIDRSLPGPDHRASLEPNELAAMVKSIRNIERALGTGVKKSSPSETKNKPIARKSIHLAKSLSKGLIITEGDLIMLRPGDGISPMQMNWVIGKTVRKDLEEGHKLEVGDLG